MGSTASYSTVRTPDSFSISNILLNPSAIEANGYLFGLSQGEGVKVLRDGNVAYDAAYLGVESRNLVFSGKTINVLPMENITVRVRPYEFGITGNYYVYAYKYYEIPPANPVIELKDISQTSIVMDVNPKGNRTGTLQRSSNNGQTWTTIYTQPDNRNTYIFTDSGLSPDKTYRYRTVHTSAGQTAYNYQGGNF